MNRRQRKEERRHLIYYLPVQDFETDQEIGRLVDITTDGIMLISDKPLEAGKKWRLRIMLPEKIQGADRIDLAGKSVWCHKDINPDFFAAGFQLDQPEEEEGRKIRSLIKKYGFNN